MIELIPVGNTDEAILEALRQPLEEVFGQGTRIGDSIALPRESWNQHRGQHLASLLLTGLPLPTHSGDRVLGAVDADIFARMSFFSAQGLCLPRSMTMKGQGRWESMDIVLTYRMSIS